MLPALRYGHHRPHTSRPPWTSLQKMDSNEQLFDDTSIYDQSQPHVHSTSSNISQFPQFPSSIGTEPTTSPYPYLTSQYPTNCYPPSPSNVPGDMPLPSGATVLVDTKGEKELQIERRKEQNRRSQKEFRLRKELRIKELQAELEKTRNNYQCLSREAGELRRDREQLEAEIERLVEENRRLRTSIESSPSSDLPWIPGQDDVGTQSSSSAAGDSSNTHQHRRR